MAGLRPEEEVPGHRHQGHDGEILVDGRDPTRQCVVGGRECHLLPIDQQRSRVLAMDPRDDLDERGFPRPIVAEEADDLAGMHAQRHILQGNSRPEVLRDAAQLDDSGLADGRHLCASARRLAHWLMRTAPRRMIASRTLYHS